VVDLGDWEHSAADGGLFVMPGVYTYGRIAFDETGARTIKPITKIRGGDAKKYAATVKADRWLIENVLATWRKPFDPPATVAEPATAETRSRIERREGLATPRTTAAPATAAAKSERLRTSTGNGGGGTGHGRIRVTDQRVVEPAMAHAAASGPGTDNGGGNNGIGSAGCGARPVDRPAWRGVGTRVIIVHSVCNKRELIPDECC
jgi:hypothetical protein